MTHALLESKAHGRQAALPVVAISIDTACVFTSLGQDDEALAGVISLRGRQDENGYAHAAHAMPTTYGAVSRRPGEAPRQYRVSSRGFSMQAADIQARDGQRIRPAFSRARRRRRSPTAMPQGFRAHDMSFHSSRKAPRMTARLESRRAHHF